MVKPLQREDKLLKRAILAAIAAIGPGAAWLANAQTFPSKPVRLIVAYAPGGGADVNTRILAPEISASLQQPVIVENRAGGGTNIANEYVAKSAPDGYTLLVNSAALVINPLLYRSAGYDPMRDFAPISCLTQSPNILAVHPSLPVRNVKELIALAKARPGALNFASGGSGTTQHLVGELFLLRTGTRMVHVPYKGGAPALLAVLGGQVEMTFASLPATSAHMKNRRLHALATTGTARSPQIPDVPTLKEAGVDGMHVLIWFGVLAPAGTPRSVVNVLANAIRMASLSSTARQRLIAEGAEPVANTPEEFSQLLAQELQRWTEVIKVTGTKSDEH